MRRVQLEHGDRLAFEQLADVFTDDAAHKREIRSKGANLQCHQQHWQRQFLKLRFSQLDGERGGQPSFGAAQSLLFRSSSTLSSNSAEPTPCPSKRAAALPEMECE